MKKTVVMGASPNKKRYSNIAVNRLRENNFEVVAIGIRDGKISDVNIIKGKPQISDVHTVTLYLGPDRQKEYYDYILSLKPERIIFNPGTENAEFQMLVISKGIKITENCTLVMLSLNQY